MEHVTESESTGTYRPGSWPGALRPEKEPDERCQRAALDPDKHRLKDRPTGKGNADTEIKDYGRQLGKLPAEVIEQ